MSLTDVIKDARIVELGKIKIGGLGDPRPKRGGDGTFRLPRKDDHFTITRMHRNSDGDLILDSTLMKKLDEMGFTDSDGKLRQLPIYVLSNDIEDILQASYVYYQGKKMAARSDGVKLFIFYDSENKRWLETPIVKDWDDKYAAKFKKHTIFNCVIAADKSRWGGVYKFRTTSEISTNQLYSSLLQLHELTGGVLRGIPLRLVVRPQEVHPSDSKGNKITTTVYVVHVELRGDDLTAIQTQALERARFELENQSEIKQTTEQYRRLLAAPGTFETDDEHERIATEFPSDPETTATPQDDPLLCELGLDAPLPTEPPQEQNDSQPQNDESEDDKPKDSHVYDDQGKLLF